MTPEGFVAGLRQLLLDKSIKTYEDALEHTPRERATDPYWKGTIGLYRSLDDRGRGVILAIMRQVTIDTTATLLAVLDGEVSLPGDPRAEFVLTAAGDEKSLNGILHELFLEAAQEGRA